VSEFPCGDIAERFWNAAVEEIQRGYVYDEKTGEYACLVCGQGFAQGVIYPIGDSLFDAERAVREHVDRDHLPLFEYLLNMNKKYTGLTEHQKNLLRYFYQGLSDSEILAALGGGSASTIRNHRFALREREKQAKVFLALMALLEGKGQKRQKFISVPRSATMVDERFAITEEENAKILKAYFKEGPDGPLAEFPVREKRKVAVLKHIVRRFEPQRRYTEKEVNEILKAVYHDYVTLRRYLIEYGFMDRVKDGSHYWLTY